MNPLHWLILIHRYLGVAVGLLMLMWCASGAVMLFVGYPELSEGERLVGLAPIEWSQCCQLPDLPGDGPVQHATLEMLGDTPVLRASGQIFDLTAGAPLTLTPSLAASVATVYARSRGLNVTPAEPVRVQRDQWTVSGDYNGDRPLYKFAFGDTQHTELYISGTSGKAAQLTTETVRFWNYFGAIPHWLYPTVLRQHPAAWSQVIIWTSLLGTFLTITGLVIGWLRFRNASPYKGVNLWHHLIGLVSGILLLTWVASGLVSMNPWGFLDEGNDNAAARFAGPALPWDELRKGLERIAASAPADAVRVAAAPSNGRLFFEVTDADGKQKRLTADATLAPVMPAELAATAMRLAAGRTIKSQGMLESGDGYYYASASHGAGSAARFPVYRIILADRQETRYYLDPVTGALVRAVDANARWYRWLHDAPHRFDFIPAMQHGPARLALVLMSLTAIACLAATGVYLGARRLARDARALFSAQPGGRGTGMIDVYTWEPNANSGKPLLGLREKGIAFKHHYIDMGKRENHGPDYLKINPNGTIPTVIDGGLKMIESTPGLEYIDDAYDGPSLVPSDPYEAWQMRWWCRYLDRDICPALAMVASNALAGPMLAQQTPEQRKEALDRIPLPERRRTWEALYKGTTPKSELDESQRRISGCIKLMEETLAKQPYLAGQTYSLAEIVALITVYGWPLREDVSEELTPHLWDWFKRCLARPAMKATFDKANPFMGGRAKEARAKVGVKD